jgi:hypothetical protein
MSGEADISLVRLRKIVSQSLMRDNPSRLDEGALLLIPLCFCFKKATFVNVETLKMLLHFSSALLKTG